MELERKRKISESLFGKEVPPPDWLGEKTGWKKIATSFTVSAACVLVGAFDGIFVADLLVGHTIGEFVSAPISKLSNPGIYAASMLGGSALGLFGSLPVIDKITGDQFNDS